ncbi:MAG: SIMPL domain-containing protein [Acidobacteria bacterium]|nr:SIMPL domain-containing protein [Acidobacteriota bacterium]
MKIMMLLSLLLVFVIPESIFAQAAGNVIYSQEKGNTATTADNKKAYQEMASGNVFIAANTLLFESSVLMNVKADEYVTTLAVEQECPTVEECSQKLDDRVSSFISALGSIGIEKERIFVDFVAQNRIYDFDVSKTLAKEKQVGFIIKKNILIYYKDKALTDRIVTVGAKFGIYDLVKVDYLVKDTGAIKKKLLDEALAVIKEKEAKYNSTFGFRYRYYVVVEREKYNTYYPTQMYNTYNAFETGKISRNSIYANNYTNVSNNNQLRVQEARKSATFYYDPLNAEGFDQVINPVVNEPVVQFTLYVRVKYELDR